MLTDLHVRDLGVIEDLTLAFGPGMTALTGETGAGKTLVVEALQCQFGSRQLAPKQQWEPFALFGLALGSVGFLVEVGREDTRRAQLAAGCARAVGVNHAVYGAAVSAKTSISKYRHR